MVDKMDMSGGFEKLAFRVCGAWVEQYLLASFRDVRADLRKANIRLTVVEYISLALFTSMVVFIAEVPLVSIIFTIITRSPIFGLGIGLVGGVFTALGIFMFFYVYPSVLVGERKKKIEDMLPFASLYLATISGSGTPPVAMFKTLSKFKEYGEISKEAKRIVDETEVVGINIINAIENAANRTPSDRFKEILWGIKTTLMVGGDLKAFLHEKAVSAMQDYRRRLAQFTEQLAMFIEMYITVVIVGSIFFLVLSTIMGGIGGASGMIVGIQLAVTFIFLPIASIGFLILVRGISPSSG